MSEIGKRSKKKIIIGFFVMAVILAALIVGNVMCGVYARTITAVFGGTGSGFSGDEYQAALQASDELARQFGDESIVLLENNGVLPLAKNDRKVNLFGWASAVPVLTGNGSGRSVVLVKDDRLDIYKGLEESGFECNRALGEFYRGISSDHLGNYALNEPAITAYPDELLDEAEAFSDTAIVVIGRYCGELIGEIPDTQSTKRNLPADTTRTYLESTTEEEDLLSYVTKAFERTIVLINSCNSMHLAALTKYDVDAVLNIGVLGQSGTAGIGRILTGVVSPSGKLTDTLSYEPESAPSWANRYTSNANGSYPGGGHYLEDIYIGYKWYETADAEGYFADVKNDYGEGYDGVVQYPFGYGLSYASFDWEISDASLADGGELTKDSEIEIKVQVTNTSDVKGADVVELYCTPPYYKGEIEKAHVNLVAFAKTPVLDPGQTVELTLSFTAYDLASYDVYGKNNARYGNDATTFELDEGSYEIKLMTDSHTVKNEKCTLTYHVPDGQNIIFNRDPDTGTLLHNQFTGERAFERVDIDGKNLDGLKDNVYLTRADFKGTFPTGVAIEPNPNDPKYVAARNNYDTTNDTNVMPVLGQEHNLRLVTRADGSFATESELRTGKAANGETLKFNDELALALGADYDDPRWDQLIEQLTKEEIRRCVEGMGFRTETIESVGKPYATDFDGPSGFNDTIQTGRDNGKWTAWPAPATMACSWNAQLFFSLGLAMGSEASASNIQGWYAPTLNLHRSPYAGRDYESYSEDPVLTGTLGSEVVRGSKVNGLTCYIKHFAVGELTNETKCFWLTEQNLRENYLRAFEIPVKEGKANAVMASVTAMGTTWCGASYALLTAVLRDEWGFRGSIITDWTSGTEYFKLNKGLRVGVSGLLNPNAAANTPLDTSSPTEMTCAQHAVKDMLFSYVNTYQFAKTYDGSKDDKYTVTLGVKTVEDVFPWWIFIVIGIDVISLAIMVFCGLRLIFPNFLRKKKKPSGDSEA